MTKKEVVLHSSLPPSAAAEALARSMDWECRMFASLSGYRGERPVIGIISSDSFRLQKRGLWRNDFATNFYGNFIPEPTGGTRIEGHFDVSPWVKNFMRLWLIVVAVLGAPILVLSVMDVLAGTHFITGEKWIGIVGPPAMVIGGRVLPKIGGLFDVGSEEFLLQHLQRTLAAQPTRHPSKG